MRSLLSVFTIATKAWCVITSYLNFMPMIYYLLLSYLTYSWRFHQAYKSSLVLQCVLYSVLSSSTFLGFFLLFSIKTIQKQKNILKIFFKPNWSCFLHLLSHSYPECLLMLFPETECFTNLFHLIIYCFIMLFNFTCTHLLLSSFLRGLFYISFIFPKGLGYH